MSVCVCMCVYWCVYLYMCTWTPKVNLEFLCHSRPYLLRQGSSLNLEFNYWADRLSRKPTTSALLKAVIASVSFHTRLVVARDTSPCLQSKHFTQRAISSASLCFVNMYCTHSFWNLSRFSPLLFAQVPLLPPSLWGSLVTHMLIHPIPYFTHISTFHNLLCLFWLFCFKIRFIL